MGRQAKLKAKSRVVVPPPPDLDRGTATDGESVSRPPVLLLAATLVVLTLAVYARVLGHDFTNFDDPLYVTNNDVVKRGLTMDGLRYAFTTFDTGNWFPLTWLSLLLDITLFGLNAGAMAFINVLLHAGATVLLFLGLRRLTGASLRPAFVAALFAVHPTHVESVAWISERKDVLSAMFGFAVIFAYAGFVRARSAARYALLVGLFAAGLMSKPMLVTIPFVLLLLDFWPLKRLTRTTWRAVVIEKVPLFVLSAASSAIAFVAQRSAEAVERLETLPLIDRIENAAVSYGRYLVMLLWPTDLAVFYPYNFRISTLALIASVAILAAATAAALIYRDRLGWLFTGWFWFLGTLVPVIGIVQVGLQSIADRYTYIPSVGIFIVAAWGGAGLAQKLGFGRTSRRAAAAAVVIVFAILTFVQAGVWKNSITLFSHAVAVTNDNGVARFNLGLALREAGRRPEALFQFREATEAAIRSTPAREIDGQMRVSFGDWFARAHTEAAAELIDIARDYQQSGRDAEAQKALAEAVARLEQAVKADPRLPEARTNLAAAYALSGRGADAAQVLTGTGAKSFDDHLNLGAVLSRDGKIEGALEELRAAARMQPDNVEPMIYVGLGLVQAGRRPEAIAELSRALQKDPRAANEFLTRAMQLPPKDTNLQEYIAFLRTQP